VGLVLGISALLAVASVLQQWLERWAEPPTPERSPERPLVRVLRRPNASAARSGEAGPSAANEIAAAARRPPPSTDQGEGLQEAS